MHVRMKWWPGRHVGGQCGAFSVHHNRFRIVQVQGNYNVLQSAWIALFCGSSLLKRRSSDRLWLGGKEAHRCFIDHGVNANFSK